MDEIADTFIYLIQQLVEKVESILIHIVAAVLAVLFMLSIPIWLGPYIIYREYRKNRDE